MNNEHFTWSDGDTKCCAGDLLCAIIVLTESVKPEVHIEDTTITDYLQEKGFIIKTSENHFKPIEDRKTDLVALGDEVSKAIGDEIEALPVNTKVHLKPTIGLTDVPSVSIFVDPVQQ